MDFGIDEMQKMQIKLQNKYKDKWESICPETGKNKLLWMIGEIGEVIDIVKKNGGTKATSDIIFLCIIERTMSLSTPRVFMRYAITLDGDMLCGGTEKIVRFISGFGLGT